MAARENVLFYSPLVKRSKKQIEKDKIHESTKIL